MTTTLIENTGANHVSLSRLNNGEFFRRDDTVFSVIATRSGSVECFDWFRRARVQHADNAYVEPLNSEISTSIKNSDNVQPEKPSPAQS